MRFRSITLRRTFVFGLTTATGGWVSACASVAGLRISTSGSVVTSVCSVTTSLTGFTTTGSAVMVSIATTFRRELEDVRDFFRLERLVGIRTPFQGKSGSHHLRLLVMHLLAFITSPERLLERVIETGSQVLFAKSGRTTVSLLVR